MLTQPLPHCLMTAAAEVVASKIVLVESVDKEDYTLTSSFVFSAIILWNPIPTPSMTARRHAHPIAEFLAAFRPPLTANAPPVKNPAMTSNQSATVRNGESRPGGGELRETRETY